MRHTFIAVLVSVFLMPSFAAMADKPLLFVGKIKISPDESPDACYELNRNGKPVTPLEHGMKVVNGDEIVPKKGKNVTLVYANTACGEKVLTEKTTVNCDPSQFEKPGWFLTFFKDTLDVLKINLKPADPNVAKPAMTIKGGGRKMDLSCFPERELLLSPWPVNGTTALHGEPMFFRWDEAVFLDDMEPCIDAKMVIIKDGETPEKKIVRDMKIGELLNVDTPFEANASYQWHVELEDKPVSDVFRFRVLGKKESENIRSQVREVGEKYKDESPLFHQAVYLMIISDASPDYNLDLYGNSLAFLEKCPEKKEIPEDLLNRVYGHCWPE